MAILLPLRLQVKQEAVRITQKDQRTKGFSSRAVAFHVLLRLQELLQSSAALYFLFMGINKERHPPPTDVRVASGQKARSNPCKQWMGCIKHPCYTLNKPRQLMRAPLQISVNYVRNDRPDT
eukprot:scaffold1314_cov386-Pavlova_lutheri.AAC.6